MKTKDEIIEEVLKGSKYYNGKLFPTELTKIIKKSLTIAEETHQKELKEIQEKLKKEFQIRGYGNWYQKKIDKIFSEYLNSQQTIADKTPLVTDNQNRMQKSSSDGSQKSGWVLNKKEKGK